MFGSNVFSSLESGPGRSIDIQSVVRSIDGLVNLKTENSPGAGIFAKLQGQNLNNDDLAAVLRASGQLSN